MKKRKKRKKILCFLSVLLFVCIVCGSTASAESTNYNINIPYYSYTYDSAYKAVQTPAPYTVSKVLRGSDLGVGEFGSLRDVFYDKETRRIFLTDTGAGTVTVLDSDYQVVTALSSFDNNGVVDGLKEPSSTCVRDGRLYVTDTGNARILVFDTQSFALEKELKKPSVNVLGEDYDYKPYRIAVDLAGRIYVIATDINDGIMLLDTEGEFIRFVAAPDVVTSLWTKFLKSFMTKAQKANLEKAVPTEYSSIVMDPDGFLYLTSSDSTVHPITKLNTQGTDILVYDGGDYPDGDASHGLKTTVPVKSTFVDIAVREDDIYAALDTKMGRIFVYDQEGSILYAFGGSGTQEGLFYAPSSIDMFDDTILVTDSFYGTLTVFTRTEFGTAVDHATDMMLKGQYDKAQELWNEVLRLCPGYDAANVNLARVEIQNQEYSKALKRLEGTSDIDYYSKAFEGVREQFLTDYFVWIVFLLAVAVILLIAGRFLKKRFSLKAKLQKYRLYREIHYSNHTMFHPFDGFWDLKHEKRGSLAAANVLVFLFVIVYALRVQFSGYIFIRVLPGEVNTLYEIVKIIVPFGLWVVANWCFTSLMDGEGTMKDIYVATAYALRPYIITAIPLWLLSHCLSADEAFIYTTFDTIVMVWMLALMFFGMLVTHDYSLVKAIVVTILTLVGMCLMLFIALTFSNIIQKVYDFVMDLYREFIYRTY